MIQSIIITGNSSEKNELRLSELMRELQGSDTDSTTVSREPSELSIGIQTIRTFIRDMKLAPTVSPIHIGVIREAEFLTIEAQNAVLKLLEEPPNRAFVILLTESVSRLLPTILSRCRIIDTGFSIGDYTDGTSQTGVNIRSLFTARQGETIAMVETLALDRPKALGWIRDLITQVRSNMIANIDVIVPGEFRAGQLAFALRVLSRAYRELETNVTPRLVVERALFEIREKLH
jgi:hypothetical protein